MEREDWSGTLDRFDSPGSGGRPRRCKYHHHDPEPATTTSPVSSRNLLPVRHHWVRVYAFNAAGCVLRPGTDSCRQYLELVRLGQWSTCRLGPRGTVTIRSTHGTRPSWETPLTMLPFDEHPS